MTPENRRNKIREIIAKSASRIDGDESIDDILGFLQRELTPLIRKSHGLDRISSRSKGYHDRILRQLLTAARSFISRDELLENVFNSLEVPAGEISAANVLLIEGYRDIENDRLADVAIRRIVGGHPGRNKNLHTAFETRWQDSNLIRNALIEHQNIDFQLSAFASESDYAGEFKELHGKNPVWICAAALPSVARGQPERALFALYPAQEFGFAYEFPRGAQQEWSLLESVPDVYAMLNQQLASVAQQVAEERRNLIKELAPSAINHELGAGLSLIMNAIGRATASLHKLDKRLGKNEDLDNLVSEIVIIKRQVARGRDITNAFNNIETRNPSAKVSVNQLAREASLVLEHLLKKNRITLETSDVEDIHIQTDAALVEHVILNVIRNAIDAIQGEEGRGKKEPRHVWILARQLPDDLVEILIANDGPKIPSGIRLRMFQKGITSKPHGVGHGYGLYICRLVAKHLGGEFDICRFYEEKYPANICFRLIFPRVLDITEDLLTA